MEEGNDVEDDDIDDDDNDDEDPVKDCSFRTRNILRRALAAARCSAILNDDPKPSASLRPEGRNRPILKIGACDKAPVDASTLLNQHRLMRASVWRG